MHRVQADVSAAPMRPGGNVHDIEAGAPTVPADPPQDKYMEAFFRDVSDIKVCTLLLSIHTHCSSNS